MLLQQARGFQIRHFVTSGLSMVVWEEWKYEIQIYVSFCSHDTVHLSVTEIRTTTIDHLNTDQNFKT